ncbi:hypothetical protein PSCICO_49080 [Pseudomonas cichorii]|uniref:Uncharacterized protein n=1 Tax=Pseudomonas serbiensis TaxID=3064350 RepID=A0ABT9CQ39_9PSED|nr:MULTISPECIES: hypothetical protein [Pseudomonas]MDO7927259.1 hypothetical protein [Pseudomonas sp. KFB-138]GFM89509.1 hypothetical protein PSCICO_49080 [Pseudomonas cichorii]
MASQDFNALIAGNTIVSFSSTVSRQAREDIADMLLYAEFFATQSYRPNEFWTSWLNYYRSTLVRSGCKLKSQIVKEPMVITGAEELDSISFDITGSVRVDNLLELTRRSFKAARLNQYARHFFQYGSGSGSVGNFQIVPCEEVAGEVHLLLCGLHASSTITSDSRGGDSWINREMVVRLGGGVYAFNRTVFASQRERIRARLKAVGNLNIRQIDI